MLKVTFNQPAETMYFEEEHAVGVRIKIQDDGTVLFKPMRRFVGDDVIPITQRGRGGIELLIEGTQETALANALSNPHGHPFHYIVRAEARGWFTTVPYQGPSQYPPRVKPHLRVWAKMPAGDIQQEAKKWEFSGVVSEIRSAKALVENYRSERRVGRKPGEVVEAERLLTTATSLLTELIDVSGLRNAYDRIGHFLNEVDPSDKNSEAPSADVPPATKRPEAEPMFPDMSTEVGKDRPDLSELDKKPSACPSKTITRHETSNAGRGRSVDA